MEKEIKGNLSKDENAALVSLMDYMAKEHGVILEPGDAMRVCLRFTSRILPVGEDGNLHPVLGRTEFAALLEEFAKDLRKELMGRD